MISRIEQIVEDLGISYKDFSQQIGVSAATLSHVLSQRNKPSLELVMNILNKFPTINSEWLLFGRGSMHKLNHKDVVESVSREVVKIEYRDQPKPVDHITVFYDDSTYCTFYPK